MPTTFYDKKLIESPEISRSVPDDYWGIVEPKSINLKFSNLDGYFNDLIDAEELRNRLVRIRRWDPNESGSHKLCFEVTGRIESYVLSDTAEIVVSSASNEKFQQYYPKEIYELSDWAESRPNIFNPPDDIGRPYNFCWGRSKKVPLLYVHSDFTNNRFDYVVGIGTLKSVQAVYRDELKVPSSEYTFYDGTQASPYLGYAFIRFVKEQRSFSGSLHALTADVYGMTFGGANESRNFATIIKNFLSGAWGMGEPISEASFTAAAADLDAIGNYYCDGHVSSQKTGRDILNDLLFACRGRLVQNESSEWELTIDKSILSPSGYFGSGEGVWENIAPSYIISKPPVNEVLKKVILKYKYDEWKSDYSFKYARDVFSFGEEKEYSSPFIRDHTTADKLICYLKNRAIYRDTRLNMTVGMEGRFLREGQTTDVQIPKFNVEMAFQIMSISRRVNKFNLSLVSHNNLIYDYTAATLNVDPITQDTQIAAGKKDFQTPSYRGVTNPLYEAPKTPVDIQGIVWSFIISPGGAVTARLVGEATKHPDDINFAYMMVGIRMTGSGTQYTWVRGTEYDRVNHKWRVNLDFPASGLVTAGGGFEGGGGKFLEFDAKVVSVNTFGRMSASADYPGEDIPYKNIAVGTVPEIPLKISGSITVYNMFKSISFYWPECTTVDKRDYIVQVDDNSDFSSPIINTIVGSNTFAFTTSLAYGTTIYFRVRPRNTSFIEAYTADTTGNWLSTSFTVTESVNIPDGSLTGTMMHSTNTVDGVTLERYDAGGGVYKLRVKDVGIVEAKIGTGAVTEGKIGTGAVTEGKIGTGAITNLKIGTDAVNETQIRWSTGSAAPSDPTFQGSILVDVNGTTVKVPYCTNS